MIRDAYLQVNKATEQRPGPQFGMETALMTL